MAKTIWMLWRLRQKKGPYCATKKLDDQRQENAHSLSQALWNRNGGAPWKHFEHRIANYPLNIYIHICRWRRRIVFSSALLSEFFTLRLSASVSRTEIVTGSHIPDSLEISSDCHFQGLLSVYISLDEWPISFDEDNLPVAASGSPVHASEEVSIVVSTWGRTWNYELLFKRKVGFPPLFLQVLTSLRKKCRQSRWQSWWRQAEGRTSRRNGFQTEGRCWFCKTGKSFTSPADIKKKERKKRGVDGGSQLSKGNPRKSLRMATKHPKSQ